MPATSARSSMSGCMKRRSPAWESAWTGRSSSKPPGTARSQPAACSRRPAYDTGSSPTAGSCCCPPSLAAPRRSRSAAACVEPSGPSVLTRSTKVRSSRPLVTASRKSTGSFRNWRPRRSQSILASRGSCGEIRTDPAQHSRAVDAATAVQMSVSHFLHLFAACTGTTFRRYQQWARLRIVGSGLDAGHDLTRCAADAGFASPSHLSETFRRTFGLSLTALLASQVELDVK